MGVANTLIAQGIPLAPPLEVRLIALLVVEAVMLTLVVLLYIRWDQLKKQPLDEWWAQRQAQGLSPRSRFLMEESERERQAAEAGATPPDPDETGPGGADRRP